MKPQQNLFNNRPKEYQTLVTQKMPSTGRLKSIVEDTGFASGKYIITFEGKPVLRTKLRDMRLSAKLMPLQSTGGLCVG